MRTTRGDVSKDFNKPFKPMTGHRQQRYYLQLSPKYRCGFGGINCPCCVHGYNPAALKIKSRRVLRRKLKQQISSEQD